MTTAVRDARPPAALIRLLNPILRVLLPSRLGRLVRPFALIEFTGRRSGSRYRVPAGLHRAGGFTVVFTPAAWRANFSGGASATLHHRGRTRQMIGTLITDPAEVADALRSVLAGGTSPRLLGLHIPSEHRVDASDIASVGREMIRFHTDNAPTPSLVIATH